MFREQMILQRLEEKSQNGEKKQEKMRGFYCHDFSDHVSWCLRQEDQLNVGGV